MITEKEKLDQKVLCVRTYSEEFVDIWTSGKTYNAHQHNSGSWSIETNQGSIGLVPGSYLIDKFDDNFVDITNEKVVLSDAIRYALEKGDITLENKDGIWTANILADGILIKHQFEAEDAKLLPDLTEDKQYCMIAGMISGLIKRETGFFSYNALQIYEKLREFCKNVDILRNYMDSEIEHLKHPETIAEEDEEKDL